MPATAALISHLKRRGGMWLVIAAIHVGIGYALCSWSPSVALFTGTPIEASIIDAPEPARTAPALRPPRLVPVSIPAIEPPSVELKAPPPATNAITVALAQPHREAPPSAAHSAPRVVSQVAYLEPPKPRYPPESRRSGEHGLVVLRVLIDELGHPSRIEVAKSSGYERLDEAARSAVAAALFKPYIENGVARTALAMIPIEFTWKSRG